MPKLSCKDYALFLLSKRGYGVKELAGKLKAKGYEGFECAEIINWLQKKGWLNDAKFALDRTRYRAQVSKWGQGRIVQELKQKGLEPAIIENALQEFTNPTEKYIDAHNFQETAESLIEKRFGKLQKLEDNSDFEEYKTARKQYDKDKKRRLNFLLRRGFSMGEAIKALEKNCE